MEALAARHLADREKEEFERKCSAIDRAAAEQQALRELRANLKPNDVVRVSRFDSTGKVVRVDGRRQTVTVSVGIGQWEIPFEEIFPV